MQAWDRCLCMMTDKKVTACDLYTVVSMIQLLVHLYERGVSEYRARSRFVGS